MAVGKLPEADAEGGGDEPIFSEINITPLTDVFLVMLIIFMAWAALAIREEQQRSAEKEEAVKTEKRSGIKVDLPSGSALEIDPSKLSLVVSISAQGEIAVLNQQGQEQRVADADPADVAARKDLAQSRYNLGLVYRDTNRLPEARAELEAAAALSRAADPTDPDRGWHLARALLNLGAVLRLANEPGPADAAYAESIALLDGLPQRPSDPPRFRRDLARALINRANLRRREPDPDVTLKPLLRALAP